MLSSTTIIGLVNRLQAVRPEDIREEDGRIQWDKFAKFGEYLSVIPECQAKGAPVLGTVSPALKAIIQETPVITDEDVSGLMPLRREGVRLMRRRACLSGVAYWSLRQGRGPGQGVQAGMSSGAWPGWVCSSQTSVSSRDEMRLVTPMLRSCRSVRSFEGSMLAWVMVCVEYGTNNACGIRADSSRRHLLLHRLPAHCQHDPKTCLALGGLTLGALSPR